MTYWQFVSLGWSAMWRTGLPNMVAGFLHGLAGSDSLAAYTYLQLAAWPLVIFVTMPWGAKAVVRRYQEMLARQIEDSGLKGVVL